MRGWHAAYIATIDGNTVKCPECGKGTVKSRLAGDPPTRMGYAILWCDGCRKGCRISRIQFPAEIPFVSMHDVDAVASGLPKIAFVDDSQDKRASRRPPRYS